MAAEGMVKRVKKEVEIHSRLKHPSIVEVGNPVTGLAVCDIYMCTCWRIETKLIENWAFKIFRWIHFWANLIYPTDCILYTIN